MSFVDRHHRHHKPLRFHKYSIGAAKRGKLVAVCIVNRPVNLRMDDGLTLEVARLCTDGTPNACSFLLSRAARAAAALGYERIQTYTLADESVASYGGSLRAAGWLFSHSSRGGSWNNASRQREDKHPTAEKFCWVKFLRD
ncbi:MAG: XF1762 family protein [Bryobacteraceae bacterium]